MQTYTGTSEFLQAFVAISSCKVIGYAASWVFAAGAEKKDLCGLTLWDAA